ncbi:urease accessory protein UreD [Paralimibaculum aggregatum]|uniref:Urease accessory protein UreD n=1 Tax=Paralimibaculum aggregatum TaxID=3036245 RepID=A0ABQ6LQY1_9RHOB|nr:urease accessory protein UreD [Limibaculum sp. NKW23]GMG84148.1 urease accessory protein UreD [Limibaculum sp. NKW23]
MPRGAAAGAAAQPRAIGAVRLGVAAEGGATRLARLRHEGSAKGFFPGTPPPPGAPLEAVLLNTAGGITGGDRFAVTAEAGPGAWLSLTTQAAERAYRAQPGETGRLEVALAAGPGARIDWLPQETILFDGSSLARRLVVDLGAGASLLAVEPLVFGRVAMGERLSRIGFSDRWQIRREGRLVHAEALRLEGDAMAALAGPAAAAGARAAAGLVWCAADAECHLAPLRALLPAGPEATGGVSLVRPGVLAARLVAADGHALRQALMPMIAALRPAPLPKLWRL